MKEPKDPNRRRLLRALGAGGALAGTAAAVGQVTLVQAESETAGGERPQGDSPRYRETDHIRRYYATLRD
ncbi:twin-arginine translocation signal domain-containing protein [Halomonas ramblicola]|uniref:twin-arginine translocation signal domain-containing protein n=1 Tax=Halomonas ramblicola TaxID=747349 RepID=UPI0025B3F2E7|nr:twin-arginine translocation signal domain-containing protein [Halomonas ramblicola]MDN3520840.1 twin-arginine translocation signal domain-containing protein [Halomonas ramblicola]